MLKILSIFILLTSLVFTQDKKYEFAKSYLDNGQFEDAARLFNELYLENPNDQKVVEGLISSLYSTNKYSELLPILEKYSPTTKDPGIEALLGDVYWKNSNIEKAKSTWDNTLKKYNKRVDAYKVVASAQSRNRLFDDAIQTYLTARKNLTDKLIFSDELIKLYISLGYYEDGSKETINGLNINRSVPTAQGRFYALMSTEGATEFIGTFLKNLADNNSKNLVFQDLLAWYFNTTKNYTDAFEVYKRLDQLRNSKGGTIFKFAETSRKDANYNSALIAYEYIIDNKSSYDRYLAKALFGYARTLEEEMDSKKFISEKNINRIIKRYEEIIDENPKSPLAEEAFFRIGTIFKDNINDYDKALEYFNKLINIFKNTEKSAYAILNIGDLYLLKGELKNATDTYLKVLSNYPSGMKNPRFKASYNLARAYYYQGNSEKSLENLQPLLAIQNENIANDAIQLTYLIAENKDFTEAADSLGRADFLSITALTIKDSLDVENAYYNINKKFPATPASERAYLNLSKFFIKNNPQKTISIIDDFLYLFPSSILIDEMLIMKAKSFIALGDKQEAQDTFSKILIDYPDSIYLQEARDSIRKLRGEF
ncbi:tetratricopeptide repeat protein [Candidatus Kapabacteria bacterium]|nr:tetratricopeptide repeat protein [Candidatus Kapabacteria bacterium]